MNGVWGIEGSGSVYTKQLILGPHLSTPFLYVLRKQAQFFLKSKFKMCW